MKHVTTGNSLTPIICVCVLAQSAPISADSPCLPGTMCASYRPDARRQIDYLGTETVRGADGVWRTVETIRTWKLTCPSSTVDQNGVEAPEGYGILPLDEDIFQVAPPDPGDRVVVITRDGVLPGGVAARSSAAGGAGLNFDVTYSNDTPAAAETVVNRVWQRYKNFFTDNVTVYFRVDFDTYSSGSVVIGDTSIDWRRFSFSDVRDALQADADSDDSLLAYLPSGDNVDVKYSGSTVTDEKQGLCVSGGGPRPRIV